MVQIEIASTTKYSTGYYCLIFTVANKFNLAINAFPIIIGIKYCFVKII